MSVPYASTIQGAAATNGLPPSLLAALLDQESTFNPSAINNNANGSVDRGIAQINNAAHPNVTDAQAMNPTFSIGWAAAYLSSLVKSCGSVTGGLSKYNTGHCNSQTGQQYASSVLARVPLYTSLDQSTSGTSNQMSEAATVANTANVTTATVSTGTVSSLESTLLNIGTKTQTGLLHPLGTAQVVLQYGAGILVGILLIAAGIFIAAKERS